MLGSVFGTTLFAGTVLGVAGLAQAGTSTYSFYCRGGGNAIATTHVSTNQNPDALWIQIYFDRGARGVRGPQTVEPGRLDPGTCAWSDRGMRSDEPRIFLTDWTTSEPVQVAIQMRMVSCMQDEHCVFKVKAKRDGNFIRAIFANNNQVTWYHAP